MEMSGQLHSPATLPSGKEPFVPIWYEAAVAELKYYKWYRLFTFGLETYLENVIDLETIFSALCTEML
jgi:hypothetical protein